MLKKTNGRLEFRPRFPCPACKREVEFDARRDGPETSKRCVCGATITLTGDDLRKIQASFDRLNDVLRRMGAK